MNTINLRTVLVPAILAGLAVQLGIFEAVLGNSSLGLLAGPLFVAVLAAYWLPTLVAYLRQMPNVAPIALVNGLLGWSGIGWIIALVMACSQRVAPVTVNVVH